MTETVSGYVFQPAHLKAGERQPGLSAFMRIRNGAEFLEPTIRSHIGFFDEIAAVYNQSTDATHAILDRLRREFGPKLRVFHYTDRVFPPGSDGHASTAANSPASMVNYSNFAMAMTSRRTVTKLDDDHIAIPDAVAPVVAALRRSGGADGAMFSYSGLNLFRRPDGTLGIPAMDPFSGSGDIGFFDVTESTFFTHDRKFERVPRVKSRRRFCGFLYWHLKYMKTGLGFANYELDRNPHSRFARRREKLLATPEIIGLDDLKRRTEPGLLMNAAALLSEKRRLVRDRAAMLGTAFPDESVEAALRRTVDPAFLSASSNVAGRPGLDIDPFGVSQI